LAFVLLLGLARAGDSLEQTYLHKAAALKVDDAPAQYRLALWCQDRGLKAYALRHYRAVVTLDPDHRAARRALGFEKLHGRWVRGKERMRAKGFRELGGIWVTPEEYALLARDAIAARKEREARREADAALQSAWSRDPEVRSRAMARIERLDQDYRLRPLCIAARLKAPDVRLRAVRDLARLDRPDALPALYKRAIFDPAQAIRKAAVAAIAVTNAKGKAGPFVQALNSPFDAVRLHAVQALGDLGDPHAVGPLVARYQVVGGSGQSVYISQVNQISFVQDFDVEVAQTSFIADPVIGVIQDGIVLNFRALSHTGTIDVYERPALAKALIKLTGKQIGDDPKAWLAWFKSKGRTKAKSS